MVNNRRPCRITHSTGGVVAAAGLGQEFVVTHFGPARDSTPSPGSS